MRNRGSSAATKVPSVVLGQLIVTQVCEAIVCCCESCLHEGSVSLPAHAWQALVAHQHPRSLTIVVPEARNTPAGSMSAATDHSAYEQQ